MRGRVVGLRLVMWLRRLVADGGELLGSLRWLGVGSGRVPFYFFEGFGFG